MWPAWLRQFARRYFPRAMRRPARRWAPAPRAFPRLEEIEDRTAPATITWTGGTGTLSWNTAGNWSLNRIPAAGDDVVIPDLGAAGPTTTISVLVNPSIQSLNTKENVTLGGGNTLTVTADITLDATLTIGTLFFSAADPAAHQQVTTTGTGTIAIPGTTIRQFGVGHTVTFRPGVTITATSGTSASIGNALAGAVAGKWVYQGTVTAAPGKTLALSAPSDHTNEGTWTPGGGTLSIGTVGAGATWHNAGLIQATSGTLNLGGSFTSEDAGFVAGVMPPARFQRGGLVNITNGTLTNTALTLDATTGPWSLTTNGVIAGGTVTTTGTNWLTADAGSTANAGALDGVTVVGTVDVTAGKLLAVRGDLTLDGTINLGAASGLEFASPGGAGQLVATTPTGTGTIAAANGSILRQQGVSHTVTFGTKVTVRGAAGTSEIGVGLAGVSGTWVNQGTITAAPGTTVRFGDGSAGVRHENHPGGTWATGGGTLTVVTTKTTWDNDGLIKVDGGTLNLGGTFTTADVGFAGGVLPAARFQRTGGEVNVADAALDNTGATLTLDAVTGIWNLRAAGVLTGGTVDATGPQHLSSIGGTLAGVTVLGTLDATNGGITTVTGDLTLDGTLLLGLSANLAFDSPGAAQELRAPPGRTATVEGGTGGGALIGMRGTSHTVTFGERVTVAAVSGSLNIGLATGGKAGTWVNRGTVSARAASLLTMHTDNQFRNEAGGVWEVTGGTLRVNAGSTTTNLGTFRFTAGTTTLAGAWSNAGTLALAGGTLSLDGDFATADIGTWDRTGGTVNVGGTITNTGAVLTLDATRGSWNLVDGVVDGGTVETKDGTVLAATASDFGGVTVAAGSTVTLTGNGAGATTITGGLTVNGTVSVAAGSDVNFGEQTVGGTGEIRLPASGSVIDLNVPAGGTLTLGPGLTVRGAATNWGGAGTLVNRGTIRWETTAAGSMTINPTRFINEAGGRIELAGPASARLFINSDWTNRGVIAVTTGELHLGGTFYTDDIGVIDRSGGVAGGPPTAGAVVIWQGTLLNRERVSGTPATLRLDGSPGGYGTWQLGSDQAGNITGGTILASNGGQLNADFGTLTGVTVADGAGTNHEVAVVASQVVVAGGLTLDGVMSLFGNDIIFSGTQTLAGTGVFNLSLSASTANLGVSSGSTLTIGPNVTVSGRKGQISGANATVINQGTIRHELGAATDSMSLTATTFTNAATGRIEVNQTPTGSRTFTINGNWTNFGVITLTSGTLELGGSFATASVMDPGRFVRAAGTTVTVTGTLDNAGRTLRLDGAAGGLGTWNLSIGGQITGGRVETSNGAVLTAKSGFLNGVTIAGMMQVTGSIAVRESITLDGADILMSQGGGAYSSGTPPPKWSGGRGRSRRD